MPPGASLPVMPDREATTPRPVVRKVAMVLYPDAQVLDVVGPLEVFARTSRWLVDEGHAAGPAYVLELLAERPGPVRSSAGLSLVADRAWRDLEAADTLLVGGGIGYDGPAGDPEFLAWLAGWHGRVRRLGSICTGALVLGRAGLLDGRRATTHWAWCGRLAEQTPACMVEPDAIYVRDGDVYTSAGVTAGMDLALGMVEEDWGRSVALAVARQLVLFLKRPGGQSQFSALLAAQCARGDRFRDLQLWICENPAADLSVPALAARVAMSERNFARSFARETGDTPGRFVARARLEAARRLLEETDLPQDRVAWDAGLGSAEAMRRRFLAALKVSPGEYRRRFRGAN